MPSSFETFSVPAKEHSTVSFCDQVPLTPEQNQSIFKRLQPHDALLREALLVSEYVNPGHVEIESGVYLLHQQLGQVASEARLFKALSPYIQHYPENKKQVYRQKLERVEKIVYRGEFQQLCLQQGASELAEVLEELLRSYVELMDKYDFPHFKAALTPNND